MKTYRLVAVLVALLAFALAGPGAALASSHDGGSTMQMEDGSTMQMDSTEMGSMGMDSTEMTQMMDGAIAELEQLEGEEFEVAYVNQIVPHHQGALEMAEAVVDRAPNKEVREAAARIIEDQEREIGDLTTFLNDTYGEEVSPDERMVMDPSMMQEIENADPAMAEQMFLLMMREHHQSAIEMGEIALDKAASEVILTQAENMVASQQAEQAEFAGYLRDFYGIEAPTPTGDMEAAMQVAMVEGGMQMPDTGGLALVPLGAGALALGTLAAAGAYALRRAHQ